MMKEIVECLTSIVVWLHRQFPTSIEDDLGWYGTLLLPGTVGESRANEHYMDCCKVSELQWHSPKLD